MYKNSAAPKRLRITYTICDWAIYDCFLCIYMACCCVFSKYRFNL